MLAAGCAATWRVVRNSPCCPQMGPGKVVWWRFFYERCHSSAILRPQIADEPSGFNCCDSADITQTCARHAGNGAEIIVKSA